MVVRKTSGEAGRADTAEAAEVVRTSEAAGRIAAPGSAERAEGVGTVEAAGWVDPAENAALGADGVVEDAEGNSEGVEPVERSSTIVDRKGYSIGPGIPD